MFAATRATVRASIYVLRITILLTLVVSAGLVVLALGRAAVDAATGDLPTPAVTSAPCSSYGAVACSPKRNHR